MPRCGCPNDSCQCVLQLATPCSGLSLSGVAVGQFVNNTNPTLELCTCGFEIHDAGRVDQ